MPARPFQSALSIGTDICNTQRVLDIIRKSPGHLSRYVHRFLTWHEASQFYARYGRPSSIFEGRDDKHAQDVVSRHLAGRWAAKEAVIKAVYWRRLTFSDVEIMRPHNLLPSKEIPLTTDSNRHITPKPYAIVLDQPAPMTSVEAYQILHEYAKGKGLPVLPRDSPGDPSAAPSSDEEAPDSKDTPLDPRSFVTMPSHVPHISDPDGQIAEICISHDTGYATATCLAYNPNYEKAVPS